MKALLYIFTICALLIQIDGYAQKANTKSVYYTYVKPPKMDLADNIKTYFVRVINEAPSLSINGDLKQMDIKIDSMERASSEAEADLLLKFIVLNSSNTHSIEKVNYKKKINDSTSVDKVGGDYKIDVNIVVGYSVIDKKNNEVLETVSGKTYSTNHKSIRFDTYNQAVYHSNENKDKIITKLESDLFNKTLGGFNKQMNDNYGYTRTYMNVPIARGKGRKHDYTDLEQAYELFDATVTAQNELGFDDEKKIRNLENCILTWENAIKEYEADNKKARIGDKNIGHIHFNVAIAKFMLKDWDGALKMLEVVESTKGQKLLCDYWIKEVHEMQARFSNIGEEANIVEKQ